MAFNNVRSVPLGGGLEFILGDYTATIGQGSQTLNVGGGRILLVNVNPQAGAEPVDFSGGQYSVSLTGDINTLTIYGNAPVTAGTFVILINKGG